jgi:predicted RecA/RadA family phage recombinase
MSATYIQRGEALDYPNASGSKIDANTVLVLTTGAAGRIGVAGADIPNGEVGAVHVTGVFELPKSSTNALTLGEALYWDGDGVTEASNDGDNDTPTYYPVAGYAAAAAAAGDTTVAVKIG